ncbi:Calx-beta domain-containing protein [Flavivirga spongiicola]|uniref:T9SS type A sorting domain-containing protein n=1 Tax=Flavivirga spongiicola TaxID=421621 RepID=A0ABU7XUI8_9FLAO|nr:Calx-beta domain-containing protein [Flavivirga sp. MEBiC05379]MDO5979422.1 Calx-beta domain-containing protein [Flavivirga sp. MEBiC05379]
MISQDFYRFGGLGTNDSGSIGFKSISTTSILEASNQATNVTGSVVGAELFSTNTTPGATAVFTIKADGVNAISFDVNDLTIFNYLSPTNGPSTYTTNTQIVFKNAVGSTIRTMTLSANKSLSENNSGVSIGTFFDNNNTLPVTGVSEIEFTVSPLTDQPDAFTLKGITISNVVEGAVPTGTATINFNNTGITNNRKLGKTVSLGPLSFSINSLATNDFVSFRETSGSGGTGALYDDNVDIGGVTKWTIKRHGGDEFAISSIYIQDSGVGASTSGTLKAYKDGAQVGATVNITFDGNQVLSSNTDFQDIDELWIEAVDLNVFIDDIVYSIPSSLSLPTVTTLASTLVLSNSATLNGDVTSDGGAAITERGFVYALTSTDPTPTVAESGGANVTKVIVSGTTGSYNQAISSLLASSNYSFSAYAINSEGTTEGTVETFTTSNPTVAFTSTSSSGAESVNSVNLEISLNTISGSNVSVNYAVTGTATGSGTDYTLADGSLTITAGDSNNDITIASIVSDAILEANETVIVTISSPTNATLGTNLIHTYTINNDDSAAVTIADVSGNENDGAITIMAILDNAVQGGFTVDVSTSDGTATTGGSDYTAVTGQTLTFTGNAGETQTFTVTPTGDTKLEANETVTIAQSNLAATALSVDITDGATVTVNNDDAAAVTIADVSGNENDGAITVTATLDNAVQGGFTVDVSTSDGTATTGDSDYTAVTGQTLTFTGNAGETQTFTVTPTGDTKLEANETVTIAQSNLAATALSVDITDGATVTINNDDITVTVLTDDASNIMTTSAILGGNVTDEGSTSVTDRGIVYALTADDNDPEIGDANTTKLQIGVGAGAYSQSVMGLSDNSGYSYRSYAINSSGTTYGTVKTFTTATLSLEDRPLKDSISLYPNPIENNLYIETNNVEVEQVTLFDVLGKFVENVELENQTVDLSSINPGIYLLRIKAEGGTLVKRIIKK